MHSFLLALLRAWGRGIVEVLLFFPALLLLSPLPGLDTIFPYWVLALTLYMPLGALARMALRVEMRFVLLLVSALLIGGLTWLAFGTGFAALGAVIAGGVLYAHGFRTVRTAWHFVFPVGLYWICLFAYLMAALILPRLSLYADYTDSLSWLGAIALVLTLFFSNSNNLKEETHSGDNEVRLAQGVVWKNRLLIVLVLVVVMAIGFFGPIKQMMASLKNSLVDLINSLIRWMSRDKGEPTPNQPAQPPANMGMPTDPDAGPSALALFLEKAAYYLGVAILAALVIAVLYVIVRVGYRQVRRLIAWLRERSEEGAAGVQDYEEEKTNLLDWGELRKQLGERVASFVSRFEREPSWERMNGAERIRQLYRAFIRRSVGAAQPFEPHLTAQEQLKAREDRQLNATQRGELTEAYNAVRYGGETIEESVSNRLKRDSGL